MQDKIRMMGRVLGAAVLSGVVALTAGCHSKAAAAQNGPDPADANMAPVNGQPQVLGQNASYQPQQQSESYQQQQPAPIERAYPDQAAPPQQGYSPSDSELAGEEALEQTTEAPPPLPEYDQPPAPGPDYIWTPGYWAWGPGGYYWVPGAWVEAPYYGALWTPPYWGWYNGYYRFYPGYWGPHVGWYGGIDYGFGYIGIGYFGGYWSGNHFYYNRAVTHVGGGIDHVYDRPVIYNGRHYNGRPVNRVSYNGGRGGINARPTASALAAMHEHHEAPLAAQRQLRTDAAQNRSLAYKANGGRPSQPFVSHGITAGHGIAAAPRGVEPGRTAPANQPNRFENRTQPNRMENRAQPHPGVENRAQPQPRVENRAQPNRFEGQPQPNRMENRAQPQPHEQPQPRVENRAMPQPHVQERPQAAPRQESRPENRPAPQQRMEERPMPQQHAAPHAEPHAAPAPHPEAEHGGGHPDHGDHGPR